MQTWAKTRIQNLVRHKGGGYYARIYLNGQERWRSLKTKHQQVAKARLTELLKDHRTQQSKIRALKSGALSLETVSESLLRDIEQSMSLKPSTVTYSKEIVAAILRTWSSPQSDGQTPVRSTDMRKITSSDCRAWSVEFAQKYSASRFNSAISHLRKMFEIAIAEGLRHDNPAQGLKRKKPTESKLDLPTRQQFEDIVTNIANAGGRFSKGCAELVQFLAYTGCRKQEAASVTIGDVDLRTERLHIKGDPIHGTKNRRSRHIPLIPAAQSLMKTLLVRHAGKPADTLLLQVNEAQKALDRATKLSGAQRITHHDLRHLFATSCIESGVDIPTVSRWLGHSDGGALAMRVYGHLRDEHSQSMAARVTYSSKTLPRIGPFNAEVVPTT